MKRSAVPTVALVMAAALVALLVYGVAVKGTDKTLDDAVSKAQRPPVPGADLALPRLGAQGTATLAAFRGRVLVVNVWASWCTPCREEAPTLQKAQRRLEADDAGTVLGITNNDIPRKSMAFEREFGITFPSLRDVDTRLYRELGSTGVPETFVLDASGRVVALSRGQITEKFLTGAIAKAKAAT